MVVAEEGPSLLLTTQPDHARLAAELLSLWVRDGLPHHPRRRDLLFAVREHDNGWREADAAPMVDPRSGRPWDFTELPRPIRFEIWRRGTARFRNRRPYPALLIARHALELHTDHRGDPDWGEFLGEIEEQHRELADEVGLADEEIAADYRFLGLADRISLAACARWERPFGREGIRGRFRAGTVHLKPFPLAGSTTFQVPGRRIPSRPYDGDADLAGELAAAPWEGISVRVAPG